MKENSSSGIVLKSKNAYYYGTTKGKSWWKRYSREGWLSRGNAEIWVDQRGVSFRLFLSKKIKHIPLNSIAEITTGKWHAGKWVGAPVMKITWNKEGQELVSGFSVAWKKEETMQWIKTLNDLLKNR